MLKNVLLSHHIKDNWEEASLSLKLIVSTEPFLIHHFESQGIPMPYDDLDEYFRSMVSRGARLRFEVGDWQKTSLTKIIIKNPKYRKPSKGGILGLFNRLMAD